MENKSKEVFEAVVEKAPHARGSQEKVVLDTSSAEDGIRLDKKTIAYVLYVFYKSNFLTRHTLKAMLNLVSKPVVKPEEALEWLVQEAAKA